MANPKIRDWIADRTKFDGRLPNKGNRIADRKGDLVKYNIVVTQDSLLGGITKQTKEVPYWLHPQKDVERVSLGEQEYWILHYGSGEADVNPSQTLQHRVTDSNDQEIQELKDERDDLKRENAQLEAKVERLRERHGETESSSGRGGGGGRDEMHVCENCQAHYPRDVFVENNNVCPDCLAQQEVM